MSDTTRDELTNYVADELNFVNSEGMYSEANIRTRAERVVARITAARDAEIREALESEELVGMFARMLWAQGDKPTAAPSSSYYMAARYNLDGIAKHIGLGDETGGQG